MTTRSAIGSRRLGAAHAAGSGAVNAASVVIVDEVSATLGAGAGLSVAGILALVARFSTGASCKRSTTLYTPNKTAAPTASVTSVVTLGPELSTTSKSSPRIVSSRT